MPQMTQISALAGPKRDKATSNVEGKLSLPSCRFEDQTLLWYQLQNHIEMMKCTEIISIYDYHLQKWINTSLNQKTIPMA